MTFFRIAAAMAAGLLSSAALAATLSSVAAGTAFHSQQFTEPYVPNPLVDSATGLDPAASLPLDIFFARGFGSGYAEHRAWVGFLIPQEMEGGTSSVGLSLLISLSPGFNPLLPLSIFVNQVTSPLPGAGETVTGGAAGSIFTDLGDGPVGSASLMPNFESMIWLSGPILADLTAHAGGILYLGLATRSDSLPLVLSSPQLHISPVSTVPLPAAGWLLGSSLAGMFAAARLRRRPAPQESLPDGTSYRDSVGTGMA